MDEREYPAQRFETHRNHLRAVAYRRLGSLSDADNAVQESWLRLSTELFRNNSLSVIAILS
jgi:RNA polymerase sigma-70 factor, ECF subfamily